MNKSVSSIERQVNSNIQTIKEQIEELENGTDDIIVNAGAGTGKTFTIVEGSKRTNGSNMAFLLF